MDVREAKLDRRYFAARLREVMGDNPKELAYDIGVSLSAMHNYLKAKRIPCTEVMYRLAKRTGRPMEWFLFLKKEEVLYI